MKVKYIKLGRKGIWERKCIEEGILMLGYKSNQHQESLNGDWKAVYDYWLKFRGGKKRVATSDVKEIRTFYELEETDIWVTFYKRKLYWCHTSKEITETDEGIRVRKVIGEWCSTDKLGNPLTVQNLDGRLTKVTAYQRTICDVKLKSYLIRKINGEVQPDVESTKDSLAELKNNIEKLIVGLWWNDFEVLIDLIFARSGWQRVSVLGKTEKDIDLDLLSPVTQKKAFVQVKSATNANQLSKYLEIFKEYKQYDEMYFVFHTVKGDLRKVEIDDPRVVLWDKSKIAELTIQSGLIDWLMTKRS